MAATAAIVAYPSSVASYVGLIAGISGLLIDSVDTKPIRTKTEHTDHEGVRAVMIYSSPSISIDIKGKIQNRGTGTVVPKTAHPGVTTIDVDSLPVFVENTSFGYADDITASTAVWILGEVTTTSKKADLDDISFTLDLFGTAHS